MTDLVDDEQVLGPVVCRSHADEVDFLCTRCLARLAVAASVLALAAQGEQFLREHRHAETIPAHRWRSHGPVATGR